MVEHTAFGVDLGMSHAVVGANMVLGGFIGCERLGLSRFGCGLTITAVVVFFFAMFLKFGCVVVL